MGRPKMLEIDAFEDVAIEAVQSTVKKLKTVTVTEMVESFAKSRLKPLGEEGKATLQTLLKEAVDVLVVNGKVTLDGETVTHVPGKPGRPKKVVEAEATPEATSEATPAVQESTA